MDIQSAIDKLTAMREQSESLDMDKAAILFHVKQSKLYKESFGTFAAFCSAVGYHRTYAYNVIRAYSIPVVRANYPALGAMRALAISKAASVLPSEQLDALIAFGLSHSASETLRAVKEAKAAMVGAGDQGNESKGDSPTLAQVLREQSRLLAKQSDLEAQLLAIKLRLAELATLAKELS